MKFYRYNLEFEAFHNEILEDALYLRNRDFVRNNMVYNPLISLTAHIQWFHSLEKDKNFYFLVRYKSKAVGVINIKDIDYERSTTELGIFFGDHDFIATAFPYMSCLTLIDLAVRLFQLQPFTKVLKGADYIEDINTALCFETIEETPTYLIKKLNIPLHFLKNEKVRKAAVVVSGKCDDPEKFKILFEEKDENTIGKAIILDNLSRLKEEDKDLFKVI
ncbi:MAG: hypothetical protein JWN78_2955 [Bacteroidota bacterium]|nr:hypothetical protein [Bacteroidota bacterium]